jgi:hypothetical protein
MPTAEKLLDLLVKLYADQEGVKINYSIERKEPTTPICRTADK